MINNKSAKAYKEVLEIIKYFPEEEYNRIPKEKIEFFENNMDKEYEFTIDPEIDLSKQNISKEANALIINIYLDYFANEEQKKKVMEILKLNEKKAELEKKEAYNPEDLFNNKNIINNNKNNQINQEKSEENSLIEYTENFFTKFKNFIMKLLHLKS